MQENKTPQELDEQLQREKAQDWENLQARLGLGDIPLDAKPKKRPFVLRKRVLAVCASVLLVAGLSVGAGFYFASLQQAENPQDEIRYCAQSEYTPNEVTQTLKEYSLQKDGKILFFDWYEQLETLTNFSYTLKDTSETIAFKEEFLNMENGYEIALSVTDKLTQVEEFENHTNFCNNTTTIQEIQVRYTFNKTEGSMMWEYDGYKYYMDVMGVFSEDEMFSLLTELLPQ